MIEKMVDGDVRGWSFDLRIICVFEKEIRVSRFERVIKVIIEIWGIKGLFRF